MDHSHHLYQDNNDGSYRSQTIVPTLKVGQFAANSYHARCYVNLPNETAKLAVFDCMLEIAWQVSCVVTMVSISVIGGILCL